MRPWANSFPDNIPLEELNPELQTEITGPVLMTVRNSGFFFYHTGEQGSLFTVHAF